MQKLLLGACAGFGLALAPAIAGATVIVSYSGSVAGAATDVEAQLTISGDTFTLVLSNHSAQTTAPSNLLLSFYFTIAGAPTLTYAGATGDVCLTSKSAADDCSVATNEADLRAFVAGDGTWQFKQGLNVSAGSTILTYGVGTVGNNGLTPNGFNGNIVRGIDYGIYAGDVSTQNLAGRLLVSTTATYTFSGITGFTEDDISETVLFGFGTNPEFSIIVVPEPGTALMLGVGLGGMAWFGRRSRAR